MNRRRAALFGIILLAFALRVYSLEQRAIWYDEANSVFLAERNVATIMQGTASDVHPPLYYFALHFWLVLGESLFAMRFLPVIFSMLSVALVYRVARLLGLPRAAMIATLLVAVSPFQITYAQELRMYSLMALAFAVYMLVFLNLARGDDRWRIVFLLAVSGALALYTQGVAVLTWIVPDVYALYRRDGRLFKRLLVAQIISLVLFAPWVGVLVSQFTSVQRSYWTMRPGLVEVIQLLLAFTTYQPLPNWFLPIALFVSLAIFVFLILELVRERRRPAALVVIVLCVIVPPALMFALSHLIRPVFIVRAVIFSSLAFSVWMAWWVARLRSNQFGWVVLSVWIAVVAMSLAFQYGYDGFPRSPFQAADAFLRVNARANDAILHDNKLSYSPMHFYDRALPQLWLPDPPGGGSDTLSPEMMRALQIAPTELEDAARGKTRLWFIIFQSALDQAAEEGHPHGNLSRVDALMNRREVKSFGDLRIFLYESR